MKVRELAWRLMTGVLLAAALPPALADDGNEVGGFEYEPGKPWQEQEVSIPDFPAGQDLVPLDTDVPGYRYFIDPDSVSVGEQDGVARYTVVIESDDGVRNVFYEGIRCNSKQYKTYAFGSGDGPFQAMPGADWRAIRGHAAFGYRRDLAAYYVCDGPLARRSGTEIVKRIRYPRDPTYAQ